MKYRIAAGLIGCVGCVAFMAPAPGHAADTFYMGTWKVAGAVIEPWADPKRKPDAAEQARLAGKALVFNARKIDGPAPFACAAPHYKLIDYEADMLFQGAFDEMRSNDKMVDPNKLAASLGFTGASIKTLETGCELDFHFVDATTAEVGLNDYVYMLKKQ